MKKILLLLLVPIFLLSCSKENNEFELNSKLLDEVEVVEETSRRVEIDPIAGQCVQANLIAGQNTIVGLVDVYTDADNFIVSYSTSNGWELDQTHLYVGLCTEIPLNGGQNPRIGLFPYKTTHENEITTMTYTMALSELPECLCIVAHAVVSNEATQESETAWMEGLQFNGNSWAMYVEHCLADCI